MSKFPEAMRRMFGNVFVCRRCKTKMRSSMLKVLKKEVTCRKCGGRSFRAIKKSKGKQAVA